MRTRTPKPSDDLAAIAARITTCEQCPRLRRWCQEIAITRRRAYQDQVYWGRPVPGFGDPGARIWIVGLAPGAHGANRTGRMFTGDSSGDWLYRALHAAGLARLPTSDSSDDGQSLRDAFISAAARCAPPDNKPTPAELRRCEPFLAAELQALADARVTVALGQIAFAAALRTLHAAGWQVPRPRPQFTHRGRIALEGGPHPMTVVASYHPSRQNTQTGRLTRAMLDAVFHDAVAVAALPAPKQRPTTRVRREKMR